MKINWSGLGVFLGLIGIAISIYFGVEKLSTKMEKGILTDIKATAWATVKMINLSASLESFLQEVSDAEEILRK